MTRFSRNDLLVFGAVALVLSAIGPWISALGIMGGPTTSLELGIVAFGGSVLVVFAACANWLTRPISIVVAIAVLVETGRIFVQLQTDNEYGLVSAGWGLYLATLAGLLLLASTWLARPQTPMERYRIRSVSVAPPLDDNWDHNR